MWLDLIKRCAINESFLQLMSHASRSKASSKVCLVTDHANMFSHVGAHDWTSPASPSSFLSSSFFWWLVCITSTYRGGIAFVGTRQ